MTIIEANWDRLRFYRSSRDADQAGKEFLKRFCGQTQFYSQRNSRPETGLGELTRETVNSWRPDRDSHRCCEGFSVWITSAIEIFKANVFFYPEASNTYDSLAEAYMTAGDKERAIENYEKSLALDPNNENAVEML